MAVGLVVCNPRMVFQVVLLVVVVTVPILAQVWEVEHPDLNLEF